MAEIQEYTVDNFVKSIWDFLPAESLVNIDYDDFKEDIVLDVLSRIKKIVDDNCRYFYFEDEYVETSWKEMVSMHYINTSYNLGKNVARVHFMCSDNFDASNYLGNITLRPITETNVMLSFVYPNWDTISEVKNSDILGYRKVIHVGHRDIPIRTFPFFSQDSIVASCAHADILMLTIYLKHVYGYKKINLKKMYLGKSEILRFPSSGLRPAEIFKIFADNDVPVKVHEIENNLFENSLLEEAYFKQIEEIVFTNLESSIPVILGIKDHVVLIVGSICINDKREYYYYDDSGYFSKGNEDDEDSASEFINRADWDTFINIMKEKKNKIYDKEDNRVLGNLFIPQHERVYIDCREYISVYEDFLSELKKYNEDNMVMNFFKGDFSQRHYLVELSKIKKFVNSIKNYIVGDISRGHAENLLDIKIPHYIWVTELYMENDIEKKRILLYYDPTVIANTRNPYIDNNYIMYIMNSPKELREYIYDL